MTAKVRIDGEAAQLFQMFQRIRDDGNRTAGSLRRDFDNTFRNLAAVVATGAFVSFTRDNMKAVDQLAKTADKLNVTTEALQGLRFAARSAGADVAILDKALAESQQRLAEAARTGKGEGTEWLRRLNLDTRELQRLAPEQLFARYSDAIGGLNNRGEQFAAIQALMGKEARGLINLIDEGSAPLRQAARDIKALSIELSRVDARQVEIANDQMERAKAVSEGIGQRLAVAFAPFVGAFASSLVDAAKETEDLNGKIETFARGVFFAFEIAANAVRIFDIAVSGVVFIIAELERKFLGVFRSIAAAGAGVAKSAGLDGVAAGLQATASAIGNVEGFVAAASERAQERVNNALAGIKSFAQIGAEADRIVVEARRIAEEQIARRGTPGSEGTEPTTPDGEEFDIATFVEGEIKKAQEREAVWTQFDREFELRRIASERRLAAERARISEQAEQAIRAQREATTSYAIGLLQALGQRSKIFALAALALEKVTTIQRILAANAIAAELAFASQLIPGDPSSLARAAVAKASVLAAGRVQAALVAATGVVQAVNLFSSGGNSPGSPTNPINTTPAPGFGGDGGVPREQGAVIIQFHGFANEQNMRELAEMIRELDNRDVIVFDGRNKNAQTIREGG